MKFYMTILSGCGDDDVEVEVFYIVSDKMVNESYTDAQKDV